MKKVVIILAIFGVMVVAMITEIVYVNKFYTGLQHDLEEIASAVSSSEEFVATEQNLAKCAALTKKWEKGKKALLTLQNHNTVRNLDDKIVCLNEVVKSNNYNDAVIFVYSAINYIDDVLLDSIPYLSNIF